MVLGFVVDSNNVPPASLFAIAMMAEAHGYFSIFGRPRCQNDRQNMISQKQII